MKKLSHISPFILLLVPVFIVALFSLILSQDAAPVTPLISALVR